MCSRLRSLIILSGALSTALHSADVALSQCAMCKASIANSGDPAEMAGAVNAGILILLVPTLVLIIAVAAVVLRRHRDDSKG